MAETIRIRRGTAANASTNNPVLAEGEPGYEIDTGVLKIGDGVTPWAGLPAITEGVVGTYISRTMLPVTLGFALSNEISALTIGAGKLAIHSPFAFTLSEVRASLTTAASAGTPTFDVNVAGVSIFSTLLTVDATETTSVTAAVPAVLSTTTIPDNARLTFDIDVAGTGATGAKIWLYGLRDVS